MGGTIDGCMYWNHPKMKSCLFRYLEWIFLMMQFDLFFALYVTCLPTPFSSPRSTEYSYYIFPTHADPFPILIPTWFLSDLEDISSSISSSFPSTNSIRFFLPSPLLSTRSIMFALDEELSADDNNNNNNDKDPYIAFFRMRLRAISKERLLTKLYSLSYGELITRDSLPPLTVRLRFNHSRR